MADVKQLIEKLNDAQRKPVLDTEGAVLVIAGAGSGKTRVLTTRIAYLVSEKGVDPSRIMAITFTNKAAAEMKERLAKIIDGVESMWVSTIHSMCVRILRSDIEKLGYDRNFTIYDETDKDKVLKRVIEEKGLDQDKYLKLAKSVISNAKNDMLSPEEFKEEYSSMRAVDELYAIYDGYESQLARSNALDFDDLLLKTYQLFAKNSDVANYYANKFQYVHIDEFQDTNTVQFNIAKILCSVHGNIFVVGDDDQSIYSWRGAKIDNILHFDDVYRGAKIYKLEQNYRSTKKILALANCIIANNTGRRDKELWTENQDGVRIETFVGTDENNEASYTAMQIKNLMARSNYNYRDFAIFMRLNALSRAYEQEFMKYGIPYRIYGGFRFFERKEIKDVLAYLKIICNPADDESFLRAVATPKRGIGEKTLHDLREFCSAMGTSILNGLSFLEQSSLSSGAKTKLFNFGMLIQNFSAYANANSVTDLIKHVLDVTSFMAQFEEKSEENTSKIQNVSELINSAEQFEKDNAGATLADYLNSVTLSSDIDDINADDAVTIATIHGAKGLEYPCVFVAGLDEKVLPSARRLGDDEELEEERRLMYVAVTRAKERLYLTRAMSRYMYGGREYMTQSRFLKEAQPVLSPSSFSQERKPVREVGERSYSLFNDDADNSFNGGYSSSYARKTLLNKPKVQSSPSGNYKCGMKVKHPKFGEGTVITVKGAGDNAIIDVAFKGVGIKALAVKYAPLEIL
ncbi:MAG: UvrD-helicase domain-containing protein [Clostridia bacterium]|nr:UvrD-helicase domain-containing protein [Clostridia bacterium]